MIKKLIFLAVLIVAILSASSVVSAADMENVTASDNSAAIQNKINSVDLGGTVTFTDPVIYENISLKLNRSVTINGNGATLKANGSTPVFTIVKGFDASIYKNILIQNLTIIGNNAIYIGSGVNITLADLNLQGLSTDYHCYGIDIREGFLDSTIRNVNATGFDSAVMLGGGDRSVITGCNFHDNGRNSISIFNYAGNLEITNNILANSSYGIHFGGGVRNILISGNNISGMACVGVAAIKSADSITFLNNIIQFNVIGVIIKAADTQHMGGINGPTVVNKIYMDGNKIQHNSLIGVLLENIPESTVGTNRFIITDNNDISNNGVGFEAYYMVQNGAKWTGEIGDSLNIVKNYVKDISNETTVVEKIITVEKPVISEKSVVKDVIISPTVKTSKNKIKKGKTITVSVKLTNFGKDKSNAIKVYNKYTKKSLTAVVNGKKFKTLKFKVKIMKKGINKIPIQINGKLIATVNVRGL